MLKSSISLQKGLLSIDDLSRDGIDQLLDVAKNELWNKELGIRACLLFFEPSTRTKLSFEVVINLVGGHILDFPFSSSSLGKGESIKNTLKTIEQMMVDVLIIRHSQSGFLEDVQRWVNTPLINAGDGAGEHPTQALADLLTIKNKFGRTDGLVVGIVGDIAKSRVASSLAKALLKYDVKIRYLAPLDGMHPKEGSIWHSSDRIKAYTDLEKMVAGVDVVYPLRIQSERRGKENISTEEYFLNYGVKEKHLGLLNGGGVVLHAGPVNEDVEIAGNILDSKNVLIGEQVKNGVKIRAALLSCIGKKEL